MKYRPGGHYDPFFKLMSRVKVPGSKSEPLVKNKDDSVL
jgi:hypothetical protein